jgi:hypothetical protein
MFPPLRALGKKEEIMNIVTAEDSSSQTLPKNIFIDLISKT